MTGPAGVLRAMFAHHAWANEAMLDLLEELPPDRLHAVVLGTYGSITATATHAIDADDRYLQRLVMDPPPPRVDRASAELSELRAATRDHARRWEEMLDRLEAGDLRSSVMHEEDYPPTMPAEALLIVQAIHHANEHRAQVCSALGALGFEGPELSGWEFFRTGYAAPDR
jgi:uncharacterized damage-inducible protein DinB